MKKLKKCIAVLLCLILSVSVLGGVGVNAWADQDMEEEAETESSVSLNEYGLSEDVEGGAILHCWCWSFNTIKENIPEIAAAGFSSIQTSPISQCYVGDNGGLQIYGTGKWYYHYQPTEYVIGNYQLGTEEEFIEMCEVAHEYGIKVIVDTVINHCTSNYSAISDEIKSMTNPFHDMSVNNWSETDRYEETQYALSGLYDWNTQDEEVQDYLLTFLKNCVADGADGFRYDAAKLIELPDDTSETYGNDFASDFWPTILQNGATFQYGEDLQEGGNHTYSSTLTSGYDDSDSSRLGAYQSLTYGENNEYSFNTTLSFYGARVREAVTTGTLDADFVGDMLVPEGASASQTVTWVESHDNYCNDASYTELDTQQVIQAWAIISARKDGTPLFFDRPNNSTSSSPWGDNVIGEAGSDMYKDAQVVAVNFFNNEMGDEEEYLSNPTGDTNVLMIERGTRGCVIVNKNDTDLVLDGAPVQSMADGTYTDQAYGSEFTVEDGKIYGIVKAGKVAVVYNSQVSSLEFEAAVSLSVPTEDFLTETIDVSLSVRGCDSAAYQLGDSELISCVNGDIVTVGEDMEIDDSVTLTLYGYDESGNIVATAEATYTKKQALGTTIAYMDSWAYSDWDTVYVYVYSSQSGGVVQNASWPGIKAELQEDGVIWKYVLPYEMESLETSYVIFNNGNGTQSADLKISAETSMILNADGQWVEYDAESYAQIDPLVKQSADATEFLTDTMEVTLLSRGCASSAYQIGEGELTAFESGTVISIGGDLESGESVTVTVYGYDEDGNIVTSAEETYTKTTAKGDTIVYVEEGAFDWENLYIYVYGSKNGSTVQNKSWPGIKMELQEDGTYKYTLPYELESITSHVIFTNNSGTQTDSYTMTAGSVMILTADGEWITYEEWLASKETATVKLYPATQEFQTATLEITLQGTGCASLKYQLNDSDLTDCENGTVITVGEGMEVGDSITVRLFGYDSEGNVIAETEATYTKTAALGTTVVYVAAGAYDWDTVYVYVYNTDNGTIQNAAWPGVEAEVLEDGTYKYVLPYELESLTSHVIFNDGNGTQGADYTIEAGTSMILTENLEWIVYEEEDVTLADKSELQTLVATAETLDENEYTAESYAAVKEALEEAKAILADETLTADDQATIDAAAKKLDAALSNLEEKEESDNDKTVNKSALQILVTAAENLKEDDYTEESYAAVKEALEEAKAILADETLTADDQDIVDAAVQKLDAAISDLTVKEEEGGIVSADMSELQALVEAAETLDEDNYTEESYAAVKEALEEAKAILADETLTVDDQEIVDNAVEKLGDAIENLASKVEEGDDSQDPESSQSNGSGNTDEGNGSGGTDEGNDSGSTNGSNGSGGTGSSSQTDTVTNVKTGDDSLVMVNIVIALAALLTVTGSLYAKRKYGRK